MKIELQHIAASPIPNTFRVAFHSADERCLLPYPSVTGLTFTNTSGNGVAEWKTRFIVSEPLDDFVLVPGARIAFDLHANINVEGTEYRWFIDIPAGTYAVHFVYQVDRQTDWYDFLAKRSRFAAMTAIWRGSVKSNAIPFSVLPANAAQ